MPLTTQESTEMKAALATLDAHIATADDALHAAMMASDSLDDLIDDASTPPPQPPVASFTFAPANDPNYPRKLQFTGAPAGMVSYAWDWGDGRSETHTQPTTANTWSVDGTYNVTLTVTDAAGLTGTITNPVVVDFSTPTPPPVASFTFAPADPNIPRKLRFTGQPAGMVSYAWTWGDGTSDTNTAPAFVHTFASDGTYSVTLTVTDAAGLTGTSTQSVVVSGGSTPPPNPQPGNDVRAELPRVQVDATYPDQTGSGIHVPIGGDLQAAMRKAKPGDTITLANGGHWTANHTIADHGSAAGWVVVRPDNMQHVPPPGTRLTPAMAAAAGLPVLHSPNNQGAIMTDARAHHYRFVGIEVAPTQGVYNGGLCRMGNGAETTIADLPHHFVFDRCYVHGLPGEGCRRAIVLNCGEAAIIDSSLVEIHEQGADSQSIGGWNGSGPWLVENNLLEAASENIIFGGGDPSIPGLVAADVTIRRNYLTKNPAWVGQGWVVKLLVEMKAVLRCLIEGNVMEFCWQDGQGGSHTNLKSVNQGGTCPACGCEDITYRYNVIHHTGSGFMLTGLDVGAARIMTRVTIEHNVTFAMGDPRFLGDGRGFLINNNPADALIAHNSIFGVTNTAITFGGPMSTPPTGLRFRDNIIDAGEYGVKGPGMGTKDVLATMPDLFFAGNVLVGPGSAPVSEYPAGNYVAPNRAAVGFAPDYSLLPSSPYKGKGTDGTDPGADMADVRAAVAGVMGPAPTIAAFHPG